MPRSTSDTRECVDVGHLKRKTVAMKAVLPKAEPTEKEMRLRP